MRGYFSRIARQTGIRFGRTPDRLEKTGRSAPSPLEVEETVIVSPSEPSQESATPVVDSGMRTGIETAQAGVGKIGARQNTTTAAFEDSSARDVKKSRAAPAGEMISRISTPVHPRENVRANSTDAAAKMSETRAINAKRPRKTIQNDDPPAVVMRSEILAPHRAEKVDEEKSKAQVERRRADPQEKKQYFVKTAQVLEGGDFSPMEIQSALLEEVREWTAAPIETEDSAKAAEPRRRREIAETRASSIREEASLPVTEENLTLSIGTIRVVVEEAEKQLQPPAPNPQQNGPAVRPGSGRTFSRLGRSYF
jgi:hypothetical protein